MIKNISEADARVFAMAIDTDGCITILHHSEQYSPHVGFQNDSRELLEEVRRLVDDKERSIDNKCVAWHSYKDVLDILEQIEPYLILKREQALLVMEFCIIRLQKFANAGYLWKNVPFGKEEQQLYEDVHKLNSEEVS
jgi:hypothetical protein